RELCFEGHRWFDLRRWGMESFTRKWKLYDEPWQYYVIEKNDPAFTLPIPDEVIEQNPGLEQNPLAPERHESL
ncbi:MAG: RagB/SusD family nutrient uptake outer membrane protein, partial [Marinifilaceae bacterium]|nr:RagB/SusD family nutrient uptake outer membrane protein [Marinifilaceae bacterium]